MRRAVAGFWRSPMGEDVPALVVTAVFFALGGLAGCFLALWTSGSGMDAMTGYLDDFLAAAREGGLKEPALLELVWRAARWPLAAAALGCTSLGVGGIPVLTSLRGFYLAFSIAAFAQAYGRDGLTAAFLLLGIPALAYVPAFFLLAVQGFSAARSLAAQPGGQGRQEYFTRCGACAAAVCVGVLVERRLVPVLVSLWAGGLLS